MFDPHLVNVVVVLYGLQASTYALAAIISQRLHQGPLTICYAVSAVLHSLLGAYHLLV
jgi:hypothetical protein